jgi:curved DNA-binding protein CbpA
MTYKYFSPRPTTAEELKKAYRTLAFQHHPDRGGDTRIMQEINREYESLFIALGDMHRNKDGEVYQRREATAETAADFINIVDRLIRLRGLVIEIIGAFVWVTGETRTHKEALKNMGFRFQPKKLAWYLAPDWWRKRGRKPHTLDEIRGMFGVQAVFHGQEETGLATA